MPVPPGLQYLAVKLPVAAGAPLATHYALKSLREHGFTQLDAYPWVHTLLVWLALPVLFYARQFWIAIDTRIQARRMGAKLFPAVEGSWPMGVDMIVRLVRSLRTEYAADYVSNVFEEHGKTVMFSAVGERRVMTTEPRYIKHILAGNFPNYVKGEQLFGVATRSVLGVGVFNADGDMWKFHRTLARPFFVRDRISDFRIFSTHADEIIKLMKDAFRSGTPVDVQDMYARFTLDSATEFLFADCVHSIHEPLLLPGGVEPPSTASEGPAPSSSAFVRAFGAAQHMIARRVRMGKSWPLMELTKDSSAEYTTKLHAYLQPIVELGLQRRAQLLAERGGKNFVKDEKAGIEEGVTLLDHLVLETGDQDIIRDSLMNMLIAGRDTTACLLTFATYALSQHPDVLAQLREEILRVVGANEVPTYDNIREMKYLRAVLNETLRLFPPVPMDYRESIKADVWTAADNTRYFIPAKTATAYSVMAMHRDTDLWGEDALQFDPARWIDDRLARLTANPFMFLPFNAGPRICLGQQFAYNESSFLLIRLLQSFSSITLRPDAQPVDTRPNFAGNWDLTRGRNAIEKVWPRTHLTMYVEGGMWATMGEAQDLAVAEKV